MTDSAGITHRTWIVNQLETVLCDLGRSKQGFCPCCLAALAPGKTCAAPADGLRSRLASYSRSLDIQAAIKQSTAGHV